MPPKAGANVKWGRKFHRHSELQGKELAIIDRVPGMSGVWTCLVAGGQVKTVNTRARSGVTNLQIPGVFYAGLGTLTAVQKTAAEDLSQHRLAQGGPADLGPYVKRSPFFQRMQRVLQVAAFAPAAIVASVSWASGAWWRVAGLGAATYVVWEIGERSGFVKWAKTLFRVGATLAWSTSSAVGVFWEYYLFIDERLEEFNHAWNTNFRMTDLMLGCFGLLTLSCLLSFFWAEIKEQVLAKEQSESPTSSAGATPLTSDDEAGEQDQATSDGDPQGPIILKLTEMVASLSASQQAMMSQMEQSQSAARQERLLREVQAPSQQSSPVSVEDIMKKLEEVEEKVNMDRAGTSPSKKSTSAAGALYQNIGTPSATTFAEENSILAQKGSDSKEGSPAGSWQVVTPNSPATQPGSADGSGGSVQKLISELQRLNQNPQAVWMMVLQEYREIPENMWTMPPGYKARVAPQFLTKVYSVPGRTGVEFAEKFLLEHSLGTCTVAKAMVDAMACIDRLLLEDRPPGLINLVSLEHLARKAYAIETAFEKCYLASDWQRPKNAGKEWSSKVDWDLMARIDPSMSHQFMGGDFMKNVRDEVKREMLVDIDFAKVRNKAQVNHAHKDLAQGSI